MSFSQYSFNGALTPARLVAVSNQSGTYFNGTLNNGVGATFTYATGALTIDSVTVNVGDRIVFAAQTAALQNGIYVCTQAGATGISAILERAEDFQDIEQMKAGQYISVGAGTAQAGATYTLIEPLPSSLGVSNLSFNAAITSGLGTAAAKSASDNTKSSVSSVSAATTTGNIQISADTAGTTADGPVAGNKVLTSSITTPDVGANLVTFDVTVGQAALATGGAVTLQASSGSKQYKIRTLELEAGGTNFSGGGGDRLGQVTDGTTVYSVVPAATMQSLVNARWGVTGLPNSASVANNTSTVAGTALTFKYSGGTTDYTAGSLRISGVLERVA